MTRGAGVRVRAGEHPDLHGDADDPADDGERALLAVDEPVVQRGLQLLEPVRASWNREALFHLPGWDLLNKFPGWNRATLNPEP